jgi:PST family polysaccharide transporter
VFRKIVVSTFVLSSVSVFRMLAQFIVVPILSRLLTPADYGVVALAMPFILFTMFLSDAGIGQSLVRTSGKEQEIWSTSFWLTILLGLGLALILACIAPLAAMFFAEPKLRPILFSLTLVIIFQAASTIPEAWLRQNHSFGTIATAETGAVALSIGSAVFVALHGGGAWALAIQQMVLYGARFIFTFFASSFRPKLSFDFSRIRKHLMFGRDVLGVNFLAFIAQSMDSFIIGKILGSTLLGIYIMTFTFARLPMRLISGPLQYVIYAHLAPISKNKALIRQMFLFLTRASSALIIPAMGMVAAAYDPVFRTFLSEKWLPSGALFMIVAPAAALQTVCVLTTTFMMVINSMNMQLRSNLEFCIILFLALMIFSWFGINAAVIGYSCAVFLYFPRSMALILPKLGCSFRDYCYTIAVPAVITTGGIFLYWWVNQTYPSGDGAKIFTACGIGFLCIALSALVQFGAVKKEIYLLQEHWRRVTEESPA